MLRASRDGEPAAIWHDNGESVQALANTAGVRVTFVHVDLTAQTTEYRTAGAVAVDVEGQEVNA
jgi:hypothetical protein